MVLNRLKSYRVKPSNNRTYDLLVAPTYVDLLHEEFFIKAGVTATRVSKLEKIMVKTRLPCEKVFILFSKVPIRKTRVRIVYTNLLDSLDS